MDAVVNGAGILRAHKPGDFSAIHFEAPKALAEACANKGIERFVQISALGEPQDGEFIESKHRFDEFLLRSIPNAIVIRPSVVVSVRGSYGGTSLLRALAALPFLLFLPGDGDQKMQPILLEDLAAITVNALTETLPPNRLWIAVGPEVLSYRDYLGLVRGWLGFPKPWTIRVPNRLIDALFALGDRLGQGPMTSVIWKLLKRGNVGSADAYEQLGAAAGYRPRSISEILRHSPSFVQDRWHARLYLLRPTLRWTFVAIWWLSGLSGLLAQPDQYRPILDGLGVAAAYQAGMVIATSVLDIALGVALAAGFKPRLVGVLMFCSVCAYTLGLGIGVPTLWLDMFGGLLKNLALSPLLLVYLIIEDQR